MVENQDGCRAHIKYPCQWLYKVIGMDRNKLHQALKDIASEDSCKISFSNSSSLDKLRKIPLPQRRSNCLQ